MTVVSWDSDRCDRAGLRTLRNIHTHTHRLPKTFACRICRMHSPFLYFVSVSVSFCLCLCCLAVVSAVSLLCLCCVSVSLCLCVFVVSLRCLCGVSVLCVSVSLCLCVSCASVPLCLCCVSTLTHTLATIYTPKSLSRRQNGGNECRIAGQVGRR